METIEVCGLIYHIKRSSRKTVCLRVRADGIAEILAPRRALTAELRPYAERYAPQMAEMREKRLAQLEKKQSFTLHYGDALRVLGGTRILTACEENALTWDDVAYYVPPSLDGDALRDAVIQLYKSHAKSCITSRTAVIAAAMELDPLSVKINAATSHWASCSAKKTLNFSWFTIMADPAAIDYIIIHELCHMRHFNHSPAFWAEVARYCPDYARHKAYLKDLWRKISAENWKGSPRSPRQAQ